MSKLTPDERRELARQAAEKRWKAPSDGTKTLKIICGSDESILDFDGISIPCFVLEGELRVITLAGMQSALGMTRSGGAPRLAEFIGRIDPNSNTANELAVRLNSPIKFQGRRGGKLMYGYEGTLFADICDSILESRRVGRLASRYHPIAKLAEIFVRGFARVGIVALIDSKTGYEVVRPRDALAEMLRKYLSDHLLAWSKTFSDDFYIEMFRLKDWDYKNLRAGDRKPSVVGRYTRNIVYERLSVPVIQDLERKNPTILPGIRAHKHHQFLTKEIGHPELKSHIEKVVMLMQLSENWEDFRSKLRKVMPKKWEQFQFADLLREPEDAPPSLSEDGLD